MATLEVRTTPTLSESVETAFLTHTYLETSNQEGGMRRGKNLQRFAKIGSK